MQIKRYEAKNMQEALNMVKAELGPEAIILKAKKRKSIIGLGGSSGVEITAAATKSSLVKKKYAESKISKDTLTRLRNSKASIQKEVFDKFAERNTVVNTKQETLELSRKPIRNTRYIDITDDDKVLDDGTIIKQEIKVQTNQAMRAYGKKPLSNTKSEEKLLEDIDNNLLNQDIKVDSKLGRQASNIASSDKSKLNVESFNWLNEIKQKLIFEDIDEFYADQTIEALEEVANSINLDINDKNNIRNLLTKILSKQIKIENNFLNTTLHEPKLFAFLGEKSSGKTTSIVKIASHFKNKNIKVGIICFDNIDDREEHQIDAFSKLSDIPVYKVQILSDLINVLRELSEIDIILIDAEKTSLFTLDYPISSHLVLDSTKDTDSLKSEYEKYTRFDPKTLIYTKFDLLNSYGNVFNLSVFTKLPISFVSLGKNVPEDIIIPSSEEIAEMVLLKIYE